jgi:hypothetical protein
MLVAMRCRPVVMVRVIVVEVHVHVRGRPRRSRCDQGLNEHECDEPTHGGQSTMGPVQVCEGPAPSLSGEVRSHLLNDPRGRWQHTNSDPASAIDDGFAIHENFVLTPAATGRLHLDSEFTTEPCRHTDGM